MVISKVKEKELEERLYKHFITIKKLNFLRNKAIVLFEHKEKIENEIINNDVTLDVDITAINYDKDNVQGSNDCTSYMEKALIKEITKLENERDSILKNLLIVYKEIRELEKEVVELNYIISLLSNESQDFISLKYSDNKSFDEIAGKLHISKSSAARENKKIIRSVEKLLFNMAS